MKLYRLGLVLILSLGFLLTLSVFNGVQPTTAQESPPPKGSVLSEGSAPSEGGEYSPPFTSSAQDAGVSIDPAILAKIEPALLKKLLTENEPIPFIVYLKAQADVEAAANAVTIRPQSEADEVARRRAIVETLQQTAQNSQGGILNLLNDPNRIGILSTSNVKSLWIVNAVAATGSLDTVSELAKRDEVKIIRLDKVIQINLPTEDSAIDLSANQDTSLPCAPPACRPNLTSAEADVFIQNQQSIEWGISAIRADFVQTALNIDGSGIVVANMDTGVDWLHPDLETRYRGYTGAGHLPNHVGNWYDATGDGALYPIDGNGHGTHTMGTIVGGNGKGVAPGATWIAVKAFTSAGTGTTSAIHDAFQWLLAPNGDPALAPDIVNNSWGNINGASTEYEPDVQALLAAGIYPIFSAGNNGPNSGTVGSPGSFDISLAVGAISDDDQITNFSSRGPSPWGSIKPNISAPGKNVLSAFPGGAYQYLDGTSMAAPHVSGVAALMLQADPGLENNLAKISYVITSTSVPLGQVVPNNDFGWGRVDAYNAVMAVAGAGTLEGTVTQASDSTPIDAATILISPRNGDPAINTKANGSGLYQQGLAAGTYDATAFAFGFEPTTIFNLDITTGTATIQDFALTASPTGLLQGQVRAQGSSAPLSATITIDGTSASTQSDEDTGNYSFSLPAGTYTVTVSTSGYRIGKAVNVTINDGGTTIRNFDLETSPDILVVDSGYWYQESQLNYYQQALNDALYTYDVLPIIDPFGSQENLPISTTLSAYDIVIWSAPEDSPGYIGVGEAIEGFLEDGGKLLLSGQDVAYFDTGGTPFSLAPYFNTHLKASFVADDAGTTTLENTTTGPLTGLSLTIAEGDGANNQATPDVVGIADPDFAAPLLNYDTGQVAGLYIGQCLPYQAIFLGFGFEAIDSQADRAQVMAKSIDWLMASPDPHGTELVVITDTLIGDFQSTVLHTARIRNTGDSNDTYSFNYNSNWPVNPSPPSSVNLDACASQVITVGVQVQTSDWFDSDDLTITAQSTNDPSLTATVTRTTRSPAPVLLVDDDRFFDFAPEFQSALNANNIPFDFYEIPKSWTGSKAPTPTNAVLDRYPMVVWYTAYDWSEPLTTEDENRLAAYLDQGGRLLISSQDLIYNLPNQTPDPFTQHYLGVLKHTEDYSSTFIFGENDHPITINLGRSKLSFPPSYQNRTDALTPTLTASILTKGEEGQVNGVTNQGSGINQRPWRTAFLAYGPELLPETDRTDFMRRAVGWLSWLGASAITADKTKVTDGEQITYTALLANDGWEEVDPVVFTVTLPAELTLDSFSSDLTPSGGDLIWSGSLAPNEQKQLIYTGTLANALPLGTVVSQTSWIHIEDHSLLFDRPTNVYVNFPELTESNLTVTPTQDVEPGDVLNYTLVLKNSGVADDPAIETTNTLPHMLEMHSVGTPSKGSALMSGDTLIWTIDLAAGEVATLTYQAVISYQSNTPIDNVAYVEDSTDEKLALTARTYFGAYFAYLPIIFK